jgi:hypothetical protein
MYERIMEGLQKWHEVISNMGHLITIINPWGRYLCENVLRLMIMEGGHFNYMAPYCNNPPGQ